MRVAVGQVSVLTDEILAFARQLGVPGIQVNTPSLPGDAEWAYEDLHALRERCEEAGLRLEAIENVHLDFYDKAMLGLPGGAAQIAHYQNTIRNIGKAGIPILGYHFMPNSVWRTARSPIGRGGATVTSFDMARVTPQAEGVYVAYASRTESDANDPFDTRGEIPNAGVARSTEEMWANYTDVHARRAARCGIGRRQARPAPRRSARADARWHRAHLQELRRLQARGGDRGRQRSMGLGPLPRLLVRDGRRAHRAGSD